MARLYNRPKKEDKLLFPFQFVINHVQDGDSIALYVLQKKAGICSLSAIQKVEAGQAQDNSEEIIAPDSSSFSPTTNFLISVYLKSNRQLHAFFSGLGVWLIEQRENITSFKSVIDCIDTLSRQILVSEIASVLYEVSTSSPWNLDDEQIMCREQQPAFWNQYMPSLSATLPSNLCCAICSSFITACCGHEDNLEAGLMENSTVLLWKRKCLQVSGMSQSRRNLLNVVMRQFVTIQKRKDKYQKASTFSGSCYALSLVSGVLYSYLRPKSAAVLDTLLVVAAVAVPLKLITFMFKKSYDSLASEIDVLHKLRLYNMNEFSALLKTERIINNSTDFINTETKKVSENLQQHRAVAGSGIVADLRMYLGRLVKKIRSSSNELTTQLQYLAAHENGVLKAISELKKNPSEFTLGTLFG